MRKHEHNTENWDIPDKCNQYQSELNHLLQRTKSHNVHHLTLLIARGAQKCCCTNRSFARPWVRSVVCGHVRRRPTYLSGVKTSRFHICPTGEILSDCFSFTRLTLLDVQYRRPEAFTNGSNGVCSVLELAAINTVRRSFILKHFTSFFELQYVHINCDLRLNRDRNWAFRIVQPPLVLLYIYQKYERFSH